MQRLTGSIIDGRDEQEHGQGATDKEGHRKVKVNCVHSRWHRAAGGRSRDNDVRICRFLQSFFLHSLDALEQLQADKVQIAAKGDEHQARDGVVHLQDELHNGAIACTCICPKHLGHWLRQHEIQLIWHVECGM